MAGRDGSRQHPACFQSGTRTWPSVAVHVETSILFVTQMGCRE
jgi:hypothetical protein